MTTTIQLEIRSDRLEFFLTLLRSFKSEIINSIKVDKKIIPLLDIEPIEKGSSDYLAVKEAEAENNPSYSIQETRRQLGL
jgi:hypothetical protein